MSRPSLGAYFASKPLPLASSSDTWNVYATPAAISLGFLVTETLFLIARLPETKAWRKQDATPVTVSNATTSGKASTAVRLDRLRIIGWYHCAFLLFFSGVSARDSIE